jgi:DNA-directed RNA polymerase
MNGVLRDAFIRIHEEDVVGRLAAEFEARYRGSVYLANIPSNSPVAEKIKEFRKKSKLNHKEELLLEHKRNTLLRSGNPWDLEAARKIVTPASIYEEMAASEEDPEIKKEAENIGGLGEIPESEASLDTAVREAVQEMDPEGTDSDAANLGAMLIERLKHTNFETNVIQPKKETKTVYKRVVPVWLPLTFPNIPKKVSKQLEYAKYTPTSANTNFSQGDFDVTRLRDSQYFFS